MSWTINIPKVARADAEQAIKDARPSGQDDLALERDEQVNDAKKAARSLLESDGLFSGDLTDAFIVAIYGHANPGHKDREGWVTDTITVTVTRAPKPAPTAQPADAGGEKQPA